MPLPGARHPYLSPDTDRVRVDLDAVCRTCKTRHRLGRTPRALSWKCGSGMSAISAMISSTSPPDAGCRRASAIRSPGSWLGTLVAGRAEECQHPIEWGASTTLTVSPAHCLQYDVCHRPCLHCCGQYDQ